MSNYEFWKDLGKIFNAVVAYQEKSIEFNKRFINPWIKIGNVFEPQDRHREAVLAYQQAVELDPGNAQNWLELGNAHFRNETLEDAIPAYQKAIDLDPNMGWSYSNLALTYVLQNRHAEAKLLYEKSIQLLSDDKDKAICWNRLGNLHRKLNEYDLAMKAFQKADELDKDNAGFKDEFDEVLERVEGNQAGEAAPEDLIANPIQLIVEQSQADESALAIQEQIASELPTVPLKATAMLNPSPAETTSDEPVLAQETVPAVDELSQPAVENVPVEAEGDATNVTDIPEAEPFAEVEMKSDGTIETVEASAPEEKIESVLTENATETFTESLVGMEAVTETFQAETPAVESVSEPVSPFQEEPTAAVVDEQVLEVDEKVKEAAIGGSNDIVEEAQVVREADAVEVATEPVAETTEVIEHASEPVVEAAEAVEQASEPVVEAVEAAEQTTEPVPAVAEVVERASEIAQEIVDPNPEIAVPAEPAAEPTPADLVDIAEEQTTAANVSEEVTATPEVVDQVQETVLENTIPVESVPEPVSQETTPENQPAMANVEPLQFALEPETLTPSLLDEEPMSSYEPVTMVDEKGEFQLEMDTKNAHVWNELGNVYFNRGSIDDAIVAYSKAIELDRWFAWPYSNLALAYVQKERFAEAMLLYQRSIELFTSNKDKAISWNRLGNVYRRLNDYDNAIASYQRADELDPDNSTIYLQSRFSLLGTYHVEQNASLSS